MRATVPCHRLQAVGAFALAGVLAAALMLPVPAYAVTAAELQAQASATLDKLTALQDKLDQASAEYVDAVAAQEEAQGKIEEASTKIKDLQGKLSTRARGMYRSGSLSLLDVLTSSTSFQAFTNNWDLLNNMNESDAQMVQETKDLRAVEEEQEKVEAEKASQAEQAKNETKALVDEAQATYDSLSAEAAEALQAERAARDAETLRIVQTNLAAGNSPSGASSNKGGNTNYYNGAAKYNPGNVVANAYAMLGQPYVAAGAAPGGFDCSGLVGWCIAGGRQGSDAYYGAWPQTSNPQPGDVCWRPGHVGIYIGNGQMIHASDYGVGVIIGPVQGNMTIHRQP